MRKKTLLNISVLASVLATASYQMISPESNCSSIKYEDHHISDRQSWRTPQDNDTAEHLIKIDGDTPSVQSSTNFVKQNNDLTQRIDSGLTLQYQKMVSDGIERGVIYPGHAHSSNPNHQPEFVGLVALTNQARVILARTADNHIIGYDATHSNLFCWQSLTSTNGEPLTYGATHTTLSDRIKLHETPRFSQEQLVFVSHNFGADLLDTNRFVISRNGSVANRRSGENEIIHSPKLGTYYTVTFSHPSSPPGTSINRVILEGYTPNTDGKLSPSSTPDYITSVKVFPQIPINTTANANIRPGHTLMTYQERQLTRNQQTARALRQNEK